MGTPSSTKRAERETQWRERLQRYATSGQNVAAFCRSESVSGASFYAWRARLGAVGGGGLQGQQPGSPRTFIDLGSMSASDNGAIKREAAANAGSDSGIEIRIDLGHGMSLHIVRR